MKNKVVTALLAAFISTASFAQKDELKTLRKIYDKDTPTAKDITEFKSTLGQLDAMQASLAEGDKVYYEFYKNMLPMVEISDAAGQANPMAAMKQLIGPNFPKMIASANELLAYEERVGKKVHSDDIKEMVAALKPGLVSVAIDLGKAKQYKQAAEVFYNVYLMDKKDQDNLYYAASYAVNAEDYPAAMQYYQELKALKYTGESTLFFAKNNATNVEESFPTKALRDQYVKLGSHSAPRDEKIPSRRGEIYRNVALILVAQGKSDEAKAALAEARAANPTDQSLILEEANLYLKLKDFEAYKRVVNELLAKEPNNADLVYNLGVISSNTDKAEAERYYLRAIEINPNYTNAYLNLAIMKLEPEKAIIDEMNKLGTSEKDNRKYEVLKKKREDIFRSTLPYLEKAQQLDPKNEEVYQTLYNVYGALEMMDKRKELKAKAGK